MSRLVSRAESFERIYTAFQNVNFAAFDYNSIKQSILEYIKLYFPETFNDFIESSEFIAVVESFAYVAEQIAYRLDVNAQENFITTAQRRDSILRLAKLVSYKADRMLPARGLVKIQSIATTEPVIDTNGINLANTTIRWNDINNVDWKQQFIQVMNRVLAQPFGSVVPTDRFQIDDVVFELYQWNLVPLPLGVFQYSTTVGGQSLPMELVPLARSLTQGLVERRPQNNTNFVISYGNDGLGDQSDTTGFFCFTKQGTMQRFRTNFDGITPNQIYLVNATNINETDVWLNNIDPNTGVTLDLPPLLPYHRATGVRSGDWQQVDLAHAQNIIFNTNPIRNKYEVETLTNNQIQLIFGDGEFSDIPKGTFDAWVRSSIDDDVVVPRSAVVNQTLSFSYVDTLGRVQTFTFTVSLINTLQNASSAETLEHIRVTAPAVYYTQDRMVNAEDYNVFPLQDSSILKLRSFNRTFAGDSKYIPWHDPSGSYENVKIFGDDALLYFQDEQISETTPGVSPSTLISTYIEPLLSSTDIYMQLITNGVPSSDIRRTFNQDEIDRIVAALAPPPSPAAFDMYYNKVTNEWYSLKTSAAPTLPGTPPLFVDGLGGVGYPIDFITYPLISVTQLSVFETIYNVSRDARRTIVESVTTQFWNQNDGATIVDYDTLNSDFDLIVILQANVDNNRAALMSQNWNFNVLAQETIDSGPEIGLRDINSISVVSVDANGDRVPDNPMLFGIINPTITLVAGQQPILFSTGIAAGDQPFALAGTYNTTITIDGTPYPVSVTVVIPATYTYTNLLFDINSALTGNGFIAIIDGALVVMSNTFGTASTINIVDGAPPLFASLTNFLLIDIATVGSSTAPYTTTDITIPILYITGQGDVTVTGDLTTMTPLVDWQEGSLLPDEIVSIVEVFNMNGNTQVVVIVKDYVYFSRLTVDDPWVPTAVSYETITSYIEDQLAGANLWKRNNGRENFNFAWFHFTARYHLVDPAASNIIDMMVITKGYFVSLKQALENNQSLPAVPTPLDLRTSYNYLLDNAMISDTVILQPGKIKLLFGGQAAPQLQATLKVIKSADALLTDNEIKTTIVATVRNFLDITTWEFGETFFFTEMAASIHAALPMDISSVVIVPLFEQNQFGDMFEVFAAEDEIFYADITVDDIVLVPSYNSINLRLNG
jgi:hypothetical protein